MLLVHVTSSYMTAVILLVGIRGFAILDVTNLYPRDLPISDEPIPDFLPLALLARLLAHMTTIHKTAALSPIGVSDIAMPNAPS
jgi:hypothetical protein